MTPTTRPKKSSYTCRQIHWNLVPTRKKVSYRLVMPSRESVSVCPRSRENSPKLDFGARGSMSRHFDKSRFNRSKARIGPPRIPRGSDTKRPGFRPTRDLYATGSLDPARKHTTKFEPNSWSLAQMTSGFGRQFPPQKVLDASMRMLKRTSEDMTM